MGCSNTFFENEDAVFIREFDTTLLGLTPDYLVNECIVPSTIDGEILHRCGYFSTMPNQLTSVATIKREKLAEISAANRHTCVCDFNNTHNTYLTPAVCLNLYPLLADKNTDNQIFTVKGTAYRYEDGNFVPLERQWEFTVREWIAVGNEVFVRQFLEYMKGRLLPLALKFCAYVSISEANDHFFPTKTNQFKERYQQKNELKFELTAKLQSNPLAIASFNYHGIHFSKEFGFDNNGSVVTGCVGCGLERWLKMKKEG
jgi:seryl-tRNA synthetase